MTGIEDGVVPYLASRHASQVLAMSQVKARLRQVILRPDLAEALAVDALEVLERATAPIPRAEPKDPEVEARLARRKAYKQEWERKNRPGKQRPVEGAA